MPDPVNTIPPIVSGIPTVGLVLSCSQGSWTNSPDTFTYQWQLETAPSSGIYADIIGATANTYRLIQADIGLRIRCIVNATVSGATPPVSSGTGFPQSAHIWGGNEGSAMFICDVVIASSVAEATGSQKPSTARGSNPSLIAIAMPALNPSNPDWRQRRSYSFTYGDGLRGWGGANDALNPSPLGSIRGWRSSDDGCVQTDGAGTGFNLSSPDTADWILKASWYAWKLGTAAADGWNGMWSDNLVPGDNIHAGWFYGNGCPIQNSLWDTGFKHICNGLRNYGIPYVGGNTSWRSSDNSVLASTNITMHEVLELTISAGPSAYASLLAGTLAWQAAATGPRIMVVKHRGVMSSNTPLLRFGLALTTIMGGAYIPETGTPSDQDLFFPAEMTSGGNRHYLGLPTANPTRSGNTWSRTFQFGTVTANFDTHTGTFA